MNEKQEIKIAQIEVSLPDLLTDSKDIYGLLTSIYLYFLQTHPEFTLEISTQDTITPLMLSPFQTQKDWHFSEFLQEINVNLSAEIKVKLSENTEINTLVLTSTLQPPHINTINLNLDSLGLGRLEIIFPSQLPDFPETELDLLKSRLEFLFSQIIDNPEININQLSILPKTEYQKILWEFNDTKGDFPLETINRLFEEQVKRNPNEIALVYQDQSLTYQDLNTQANQLAHYLKKWGVALDILVGLCIERSPLMIIGILGIIKAGGAYLPLDPNYPQERLELMIEDAQISVLVTQEKLQPRLPHLKTKTILIDTDWGKIAQENRDPPETHLTPENLAYVIYTSGSTGKPKGTLITHKGLYNLVITEIKEFRLTNQSRMVQFASINFDASVSEIFTTLCSGAKLYLATSETLMPGASLIQFLQTYRITHAQIPPSALAVLPATPLPDLEVLIVGGEACSRKLIEQWAPGRRFLNVYGPTEATIEVTIRECLPGTPPYIGKAIANTEIYILNNNLKPVPIGIAGELHIGGVGLARGYHNQPELTTQKFIPHPFSNNPSARLYKSGDLARYLPDGNIEWLGRIDYQVKIRGFRIEIEEIEDILILHPTVNQVAVIPHQDSAGDTQLIAYVVAPQNEPLIPQLRSFLKEKLPPYAIPATFILLDKFPLTPSDKIDRQALAKLAVNSDLFFPSENFVPPRTPEEEKLTEIWSEILGVRQVGIYDNFFELGGHSLKAVALCNQLLQQFNINLPINIVLELPTVAQLVSYLQDRGDFNLTSSYITNLEEPQPTVKEEYFPLSFTQEKRWIFQQSNRNTHYWSNLRQFYLNGELNLEAFRASFEEIIRRHDILRTNFLEVNGSPKQKVNPTTPFKLVFVNLALETLTKQTEEVARLTEEFLRYPFDLAQDCLLRVMLIQTGKTSYILLIYANDLIIDDSSFKVLFQELSLIYEAFILGKKADLPALPLQYTDYVYWQRKTLTSTVWNAKLDYWRAWLAPGEPSPLELFQGKDPRFSPSDEGANKGFELSVKLSKKLQRISQEKRVTIFMIFLAGFARLLHQYSNGCQDLVIASPRVNRNHWKFEPLIGVLSNMMLLRIDLRDNPDIDGLLLQSQKVTLDALVYQDLPFEEFIKTLLPQRKKGKPFTKILLTILPQSPHEELKLSGLRVNCLEAQEFISRPDLELSIWQEKTGDKPFFKGEWQYKKDLFSDHYLTQMTESLLNLLEEF